MEDIEKLNFYKAAKFFIRDGYLFNTFSHLPSQVEFEELKKEYSKNELEKLYNHIHLSSITDNFYEQIDLGHVISKSWRRTLSMGIPEVDCIIELIDDGYEVVIYVSQFKT